jgi:glycosyltransferase involved in cell wall biosynthesis
MKGKRPISLLELLLSSRVTLGILTFCIKVSFYLVGSKITKIILIRCTPRTINRNAIKNSIPQILYLLNAPPEPIIFSLVHKVSYLLRFIINIFTKKSDLPFREKIPFEFDFYNSKELLHKKFIFQKDLNQVVHIVVRDIPLHNRAGSYLRLIRLCKVMASLGHQPLILYLNHPESTIKWWEISKNELDSVIEHWQSLGFPIVNFYDFYTKNQHFIEADFVWLHDIHSAREFFNFTFNKFVAAEVILDLVDLEFRRLEQNAMPPDLIRANKDLLNFCLRHSDYVISISGEEEAILKSTFSYIPNSMVISNIYPDFGDSVTYLKDSKYDFMFLGNFLHRPNIEAVDYIFRFLAPELQDHSFAIVGGGASEDFISRHSMPNIIFLGPVNDLSVVYTQCKSVIAPLITGAGVKGKVIEALNFGVPVIGSAVAWEGIPLPDNQMGWVANDAREYLNCIMELETKPIRSLSVKSMEELNSKFGALSASSKIAEIFGV